MIADTKRFGVTSNAGLRIDAPSAAWDLANNFIIGWDDGLGDGYTTTWWNGRGEVVNKAAITELPTKPGETVGIKRQRTEQPFDD